MRESVSRTFMRYHSGSDREQSRAGEVGDFVEAGGEGTFEGFNACGAEITYSDQRLGERFESHPPAINQPSRGSRVGADRTDRGRHSGIQEETRQWRDWLARSPS